MTLFGSQVAPADPQPRGLEHPRALHGAGMSRRVEVAQKGLARAELGVTNLGDTRKLQQKGAFKAH